MRIPTIWYSLYQQVGIGIPTIWYGAIPNVLVQAIPKVAISRLFYTNSIPTYTNPIPTYTNYTNFLVCTIPVYTKRDAREGAALHKEQKVTILSSQRKDPVSRVIRKN